MSYLTDRRQSWKGCGSGYIPSSRIGLPTKLSSSAAFRPIRRQTIRTHDRLSCFQRHHEPVWLHRERNHSQVRPKQHPAYSVEYPPRLLRSRCLQARSASIIRCKTQIMELCHGTWQLYIPTAVAIIRQQPSARHIIIPEALSHFQNIRRRQLIRLVSASVACVITIRIPMLIPIWELAKACLSNRYSHSEYPSSYRRKSNTRQNDSHYVSIV